MYLIGKSLISLMVLVNSAEPSTVRTNEMGAVGLAATPQENTASNSQQQEPAAQKSDGMQSLPAMESTTSMRLLIMDVVDKGLVDKKLYPLVQKAIQEQAKIAFTGETVALTDIRAQLDAAARKQLLGCDTEGCMVNVADQVDAQRVLGGNLAQVGDEILMTLIVVDTANGARLGEAQKKVSKQSELLSFSAKQLVAEALGAKFVAHTVPVLIDVSAENTEVSVSIDGAIVGQAPIVAYVTPGSHQVEIESAGYSTYKTKIQVTADAPVYLNPELQQSGITLWPATVLFWGGSMTLGVAGLAAGLLAQDLYAGNVPLFPVDEKTSYLHASPVSTPDLSQKEQQIIQLMWTANILYGSATLMGVAGAAVMTTDVVLSAME
jgi:hypothetical protein